MEHSFNIDEEEVLREKSSEDLTDIVIWRSIVKNNLSMVNSMKDKIEIQIQAVTDLEIILTQLLYYSLSNR